MPSQATLQDQNVFTDLKTNLVQIIQNYFTAQQKLVKVFTADPQDWMELPCIALNYIYDSEDNIGFNNMLDVELASVPPGTNNASYIRYVALMTQTVECRVWAQQPDLRDLYGIFLKEGLLLSKPTLEALGFGNIFIKQGRDENDLHTYQPKLLYWRVYHLTALAQLEVTTPPDTSSGIIKTVSPVVSPITPPPINEEEVQVIPQT